MPVHDWSRVEAGIFHHFHHAWIEEIARALNHGLLPADYYAMAEQHAAGFGPDVLTLQETGASGDQRLPASPLASEGGLLLTEPRTRLKGETDLEFYRRKQSLVAVRHVSGDTIVAMVEVVSPGNKSSRAALRSFVEKTAELLMKRIHLLILDVQPTGPRDPQGIHGAIWEELTGQEYLRPTDKPLTAASYEAGLTVRYFVEPIAIGDELPQMPLFLKAGAHVAVPVEKTYLAAFAEVPGRWRRVLEALT